VPEVVLFAVVWLQEIHCHPVMAGSIARVHVRFV